MTRLAVTGCAVHLPGTDLAGSLEGRFPVTDRGWAEQARAQACAPTEAATVLGRKGLLAKDAATRLALCAVHRALRLPLGRRAEHPPQPDTAVVACGNLGNTETVVDVVRTVTNEGSRAVSVLSAPNASSNVVASAVALWFGFTGPNLMVCSGPGAGGDGLHLAGLLLRARRADRVVLVGVEPDDPVAAALYGAPLLAGAACVVLTRPDVPDALATLATVADDCVPAPTAPAAELWGDLYGALGVVDLAVATHLVADEGRPEVGVGFPAAPAGRRAVAVRTSVAA
jgi:3-oxoacyl-[acyl-carrier-protein] synthase II